MLLLEIFGCAKSPFEAYSWEDGLTIASLHF